MTYYYSINSKMINEICVICREELKNTSVVSHVKSNNHCSKKLIHAVHKACVEDWLKIHSSCPTCHASIDKSLPFRESLKEKVIKEIKIVGKDMIVGCCGGGLIGAGIEIAKEKKVILCALIVLEVFTRKVLGMKPQVAITIVGATLLASLFIESTPLILLGAGVGASISPYLSRSQLQV